MSRKRKSSTFVLVPPDTPLPKDVSYSQSLLKKLAELLPGKQRGDIVAAAQLLSQVADISPNTKAIDNTLLLRWFRIILAKQPAKIEDIANTLEDFRQMSYREVIWQEIANILPHQHRGNVAEAVKLLTRLSKMSSRAKQMSNPLLFRRIMLIAEKQIVTVEGLAYIFENENNYTRDGFFIAECWSCKRQVCLVQTELEGI
jgi:hypothetical protein